MVPDKKAVSGDVDVAVVIDQSWLDDPARQFPITIDPTYIAGTDQGPLFDTSVKEEFTFDRSSQAYLSVGYGLDSVQNRMLNHRSFLNFDTSAFSGTTISSATLSLWGEGAGSCTPKSWSAYDAGLASTSSRWTAQPSIGTKYSTSNGTKGFDSSCAAGWVEIDMKTQLQTWTTGSATVRGIALKADPETTTGGYHRFTSSEGAAGNTPVLRWTFEDPDSDEAANGPTDSYTVDPNAPSVDETPFTGEEYASAEDAKIDPNWWKLIIRNKSNTGMYVCREWLPCPNSTYRSTYLSVNHNTKTDFNWNDTDGVFSPGYRQVKADQVGTNPVLCRAKRAGYWCKVSPRFSQGTDTRNFYFKYISNP